MEKKKHFSINKELLISLPAVIRCSKTDICITLNNLPNTTYEYYVNRLTIPLDSLITICNTYRISIWSFICVDDYVPETYNIKINKKHKLIGFDVDAMEAYMTTYSGKTVVKAAGTIHIGLPKWYRIFGPKKITPSVITLKDYLEWCDTLGVNPNMFINDVNEKFHEVEEYVSMDANIKSELYTIASKKGVGDPIVLTERISELEIRLAKLEELIAKRSATNYFSNMVAEDEDMAYAMEARTEEMSSED